MVAQVVLTLTGPMDHLRLVWQTGETLLQSVEFSEDPEGTRYNVLLALQEMVTNVLRHAYELDESRPIQVVFTVTTTGIEVALRDTGPAFNPLEHDITHLEFAGELPMPTQNGGFGIYIARLVMDEVAYERQGEWNVLRMRKLVGVSAPTKDR